MELSYFVGDMWFCRPAFLGSYAIGDRETATRNFPSQRSAMVRRAGTLGLRYRYRLPSVAGNFTPGARNRTGEFDDQRFSAQGLSTADCSGSGTHVKRCSKARSPFVLLFLSRKILLHRQEWQGTASDYCEQNHTRSRGNRVAQRDAEVCGRPA